MSTRLRQVALTILAAALAGSGCGDSASTGDATGTNASAPAAAEPTALASFGPAPAVPSGETPAAALPAARTLLDGALDGPPDTAALDTLAGSGDPRLAWVLSDVLRFTADAGSEAALLDAFAELTGTDVRDSGSAPGNGWQAATDHLIAWDLPAPTDYRELKASLFTRVEAGWKPFFDDADSAIDWRLLSWGGVLIDARPLDDPKPCPNGCIPALDDPALTDAAGGDWYPDSKPVFGVTVGGETVAFPKNIMEVHEMVNITIGGHRLGILYCTLCGSAQAYFLDSVPDGVEQPVLRTSGLLSRSNKVMYDLRSESVLDTFTGEALSGPLHDAGVTLKQASVEVSSWGKWKRAHPDTRIVAEDGGIGRTYPANPLGNRDANGPIFPVGDVDPRLPVQEQVLGVTAPSGRAVAFPADAARQALAAGEPVRAAGVEVSGDGGGLRARTAGGGELPSHQAFWFAWSQFNPDTLVWSPQSKG